MPVKRRIGKTRRAGWTDEHRSALATGSRYLGAFGSHRDPWPLDEAALAWADLREGILAEWAQRHPCLRPWGWWVIDHGLEYPSGKSRQRRYLHEHGHLTPDELEMIEADPSLLELKPYGGDF